MIHIFLTSFVAQSPISIQEKLAHIERSFDEQRIKDRVPGAALVIVKDGKVIFMKGFGVRSLKSKRPVDIDTLFSTQSISKTFTATAFMKAVDEGKMAVDDRPVKFLPWLKFKDPEIDAKVTFRDLLSHRSGMGQSDYVWLPNVLSRKGAIRVAAQATPTAKLGERLQYNNLMFSAVGDAVGAAYKTSWERVVESKLLTPLGMTRTTTTHGKMQRDPNHADTHDTNLYTREVDQIPNPPVSAVAPASAICSSARDMGKWLTMAVNGGSYEGRRILSERAWEEMMTLQFRLGDEGGWLLGWSRRDWRGHKTIFHSGGGYGWTAMMAFMPEQKVGFVFLSNLTTAAALRNAAGNLVWTAFVDDKPAPAPPAPSKSGDGKKPEPAPADLEGRLLENQLKVASLRLECDVDYPQQGLTGEAVIDWMRPGKVRRYMTLQAGKRRISDLDMIIDGETSRSKWSWMRGGPFSAEGREETLYFNDIPALGLIPIKNLQGATTEQRDGQTVYVLRRLPSVTEYVLARDSRVISRETTSGYRQQFSDWRMHEGVMMPFLIREFWPGLGEVVLKVKRVTANNAKTAMLEAKS